MSTSLHSKSGPCLRRSKDPLRSSSPLACDDKAKPTTLPRRAQVRDSYECVVDFRKKPFSIVWRKSLPFLDLPQFPIVRDAEVFPIEQSLDTATIWRNSTLLGYGSFASIRVEKNDGFPVLRLPHSDKRSSQLIRHEFTMLADLRVRGVPVPETYLQPVTDDGGICGYRMEVLLSLDTGELHSRSSDIEQALIQLHSAGFVHGDISPNNIMKDKDDNIILIDFGISGRIGDQVLDLFPTRLYPSGIFTASTDWEAWNKYLQK
ncbi:hypothetical protein F5Y15DRAFT_428594 [Xylariaceae sp. FL0016]|nr:hypothetical protein F5Y15DRAFT_428594 [Xylariaceae sp. FL0016]